MKRYLFLSLAVLSLKSFAAYEDQIPAYFEYCGTTQWKTTDGQIGGSTGHAFTYIHGLCKNYSEKFPQVTPCHNLTAEERSIHPHEGVGISLDKNFSNVNWIAVPGRELMLFGELDRRAPDASDVVALQKRAAELRVFEGVKLLDGKVDGVYGTQEYADNVARNTLGTDIAVNWARSLYCVRVPVKEESLSKVADFLNKENQKYQFGNPYKWDMIKNNCVHLSINQGHALGVNKSITPDRPMPLALLNLAVPANGYMMYADQTVLKKPSYSRIKKDFKKKGFSSIQVGSILTNYQAYPNGDTFVTEGLGLQSLPRVTKPLKLLMTPEKYKKYLTEERTLLKANALKWSKLYEEYLTKAEGEKKVDSAFIEYLRSQLRLSNEILSE